MAAETREDGGGKRLRLGLVDDVDDVSMPGLTSDTEDDDNEDEDEDEDEDDDADEELSEEEAQRRYFEDRQKQAKASADSWAAFFERKAGQQRAAQQHADAQRAAGPPSDAFGASASASEEQHAGPTIRREREWAATCFTERGDNKRADYSKGELAELMRQAQAFIKETFESNRQKRPKPSDKKALSAAVNEAHRRFGIPLTSLRNYWSGEGKTPSSRNSQVGISKPGVKPLLQKNPDGIDLEGKLVDHLLHCAELGLGLDWPLIELLAKNLAERYSCTTDKGFKASNGWKQRFMRRHSELTHRTAINLDFSRAGARNKELYDHFFRQILPNAYAFVEGENGKPLESWMFLNMDESGISVAGQNYVVTRKGVTSTNTTGFKKAEHISVACAISPRGLPEAMPLCFLMKGKNKSKAQLQEDAKFAADDPRRFRPTNTPSGTSLIMTENAYMTDAAYVQWCKLFVEFINELRQQKAPGVENEKLWVILYLDGYGSHALNPEALEILHDGCIYCVGMPSHSSQDVQALDRSVFSGTKRCMRSEVAEYQFTNNIREISRWDIPSLFHRAWERSATADNAASGFDVCGVYPLRTDWVEHNPHVFKYSEPLHDPVKEIAKVTAKLTSATQGSEEAAQFHAKLTSLRAKSRENALERFQSMASQRITDSVSVKWTCHHLHVDALDLAVTPHAFYKRQAPLASGDAATSCSQLTAEDWQKENMVLCMKDDDMLNDCYENALAHMTTHVSFKKICKVPNLRRRKVLNKDGSEKKNKAFNSINEPHATAKYLNCPNRIEKLKQHATDQEAKVEAASKKKQENQDRDETLQKLFIKLNYMGPKEKLALKHLDAFMKSQEPRVHFRNPNAAVKMDRNTKVEWLTQYVQTEPAREWRPAPASATQAEAVSSTGIESSV